MKGQLMSFDLLVALVLLTLALGIVINASGMILTNYQIQEKVQLNTAQMIADKAVIDCKHNFVGYNVGYSGYWVMCGTPHNSLPSCENKLIGRRYGDCGGYIGELKVISCA